MHRHADEGSATIWTLGVALVVVSIVYAALMVCVAIATRQSLGARNGKR